jgi:hypothetical protein
VGISEAPGTPAPLLPIPRRPHSRKVRLGLADVGTGLGGPEPLLSLEVILTRFEAAISSQRKSNALISSPDGLVQALASIF